MKGKMLKDLSNAFLSNSIAIYLSFGILIAIITQSYRTRKKTITLKERFLKHFITALFTASCTLPLLKMYPELPPEVAMPIGGFVGVVGLDGINELIIAVKNRLVNTIDNNTSLFNYNYRDNQKRHTYFQDSVKKSSGFKRIEDEPPMPDDLREDK